jgi:putative lipoprotein
MAQTITGTATYRERMVLPAGAVFEATLEDVSRADAPSETIARQRLTSPGNPPIAFTISYDPAKISANRQYVVRARILVDDKPLFTTDTTSQVITRGSPTSVSLLLRRIGGGQTAAPTPGSQASTPTPGSRPIEGTRWRATELAGKPTPAQNVAREAHLEFAAGGRVSGSDGCNRLTGTYTLKGDVVTFGQMAGTQMACAGAAEIEAPFREALKSATRMRVTGDRLELSDTTGRRLAVFTAQAPLQAAGTSPSSGLQGTSWQLVKFQGGDAKTLTPDDGSKYTIEFGANGQLTARIDCNRGRGSWSSRGPSQLQLDPLALTRAACPPGSMHDQIVKQWSNVRSYVLRDGHLFLSLMADGGIYEFERR